MVEPVKYEENEDKNSKEKYNYDEAVEMIKTGRYTYYQLLTCCIAQLAAATDMFAFALIVATSSCDLDLTMQQKGLLNSIPFAGLLFAFPWGFFADQSGRRRALLLSLTVGFFFSSLATFASTWYIMAAFKFIGCSFSSAAMSLSMTYMGECAGSSYRSRYLGLMNCSNLFSEFLYYVASYFILGFTFNLPIPFLGISFRPWRLLSLVLTMLLGISALMMTCLKESPKFLADKGRVDEALDIIQYMYEANGGKPEEFPVKAILLPEKQERAKGSWFNHVIQSIVPLFKRPLLKKTAQLYYLAVILCTTNNVLTMWFPVIVNTFFLNLSGGNVVDKSFCQRITENHTGSEEILYHSDIEIPPCVDTLSPNLLFCGCVYAVFFTTVNLVITKVANHRRTVILTVFAVSASSCLLIDFVHNAVANLIFLAFIQVTAVCIGIVGSYFVDMFPTSHRALVTSLGMMTARLGTFTLINVVGVVIMDYCRPTFLGFTLYIVSGFVVACFLPPNKILKSSKKEYQAEI